MKCRRETFDIFSRKSEYMKKRKIKKGNLLFLSGCILLFISVVVFVVMFLGNQKPSAVTNSEKKVNNYTAFQEVVVSDQDIDTSYNDKLVNGIKNWVNSTLAMDDTYSSDSKTKLLRKLYTSIEQDEQRNTIKNSLSDFYSAKSITTQNIDVSISEAKEAQLNNKTIGQVKCVATVSGVRDGTEFQNKYDMTLFLSLDTDQVGIYVVKDIIQEF